MGNASKWRYLMKGFMKNLYKIVEFLLPILLFIIIWEIFAAITNSSMLPSPTSLTIRIQELTQLNQVLQTNIIHSIYRFAIGCTLAIISGTCLGILMGLNNIIYKMFKPIVSLFVSLPTLAWVPLLLVFIGIGNSTIIVAIFLGAFFPIVYNTTMGIQGINLEMIMAAKTMGADKYTIFTNVILPGSLVSILTGLRLAIGNSWRALVGAEMLAATKWGLGYMIFSARTFYDIQSMFVGLICIGLLSFLIDTIIVKVLESKTISKWGLIRSN